MEQDNLNINDSFIGVKSLSSLDFKGKHRQKKSHNNSFGSQLERLTRRTMGWGRNPTCIPRVVLCFGIFFRRDQERWLPTQRVLRDITSNSALYPGIAIFFLCNLFCLWKNAYVSIRIQKCGFY